MPRILLKTLTVMVLFMIVITFQSFANASVEEVSDTYYLDFKNAYIVCTPATEISGSKKEPEIQVTAEQLVLSYGGDWDINQPTPEIYHFRQKKWNNLYWKVDTRLKQAYTVTDGVFGDAKASGTLISGIRVSINDNTKYIFLNFSSAYIVFEPKGLTSRIIAEDAVILDKESMEVNQISPSQYQIRPKLWRQFKFFWKADTAMGYIYRIMDGNFGAAGGTETLTKIDIRNREKKISPIGSIVQKEPEKTLPEHKKSDETISGKTLTKPQTERKEDSKSSGILNDIVFSQFTEARLPKSDWVESQKKLFSELIKKSSYDVLVVPFQVQGYAIDRIGRSLMMRYLVDRIENRTDMKIPDPTVVARSLGELSRTFNNDDVYQLANALKVKTLIKGYVGHNLDEKMQLTLLTQSRDKDGQLSSSTETRTFQWKDIPFSDQLPPSEAFYGLLDDIMTKLQIKETKKTITTYYDKQENLSLPDTVWDMVSKRPASPVISAYYLQILGVLFPEQTPAREQLFERSLVALTRVNSSSPDYALLRTRAYFYLNRRPAALAVLKAPAASEEKALSALLNGNMIELEKLVGSIKGSLPKLLAQLELNDLRWAYKNNVEAKKAYNEIVRDIREWELVVMRRLQSHDPWEIQSNLSIKQALDKFFPLPGVTAASLSIASSARGDFFPEGEDIDFSVQNHYHNYVKNHGRKLMNNEFLYPVERDLLDLLAANGEANLLKNVRLRINTQGSYEAGLEMIDRYERIYQDHPDMSLLRFRAMTSIAATKEGQLKENMNKRANDLAYNACYCLQGQEYAGRETCYRFNLYGHDYPGRWYWHYGSWALGASPGDRKYFDSEYISRDTAKALSPENKNALKYYELTLQYTNTDFRLEKTLYEQLHSLGLDLEADAVMEKNRNRFIGHPVRTVFMSKRAESRGAIEEAMKIYEDAIVATPQIWEPYEKLGFLLVSKGDFRKAAETFQRYSLFHIPQESADYGDLDTVALSNYAAKAGFRLLKSGAILEAIPFLEKSRDYKTGSGNGMVSSVQLHLIEGSYVEAALGYLEAAKRYNNKENFDDYIGLLHLMGHHQEAWSLYSSLKFMKYLDYSWTAPFVGHRLEGITEDEQLKWFLYSVEKNFSGPEVGQKYLLLTRLIDRTPNESTSAVVDELYAQTLNAVKTGQPMTLSEMKSVESAKFNPSSSPRTPLAWFASGYYSIRTRDFAKAFEVFKGANGDTYLNYKSHNYSLSYTTWSAVKLGRSSEMKTYLNEYKGKNGQDIDYHLAMAFMAAGLDNHLEAIEHLKSAQYQDISTGSRPLYIYYQLVETCEWLYEDTNNPVYKNLALKLARIYQRFLPKWGWIYAVEAKYTDSAKDRIRALALALYLDKNSERISSFSDSEKKEAREWLGKNNPFLQDQTKNMDTSL